MASARPPGKIRSSCWETSLRYKPFAGMDSANGADHIRVHHLFQQISANSRFERAIDILIAVVGGQGDDLRVGEFAANLARGLNAVLIRQAQIHQRDIGPMLPVQADCVFACIGFGDQLKISLGRQNGRQDLCAPGRDRPPKECEWDAQRPNELLPYLMFKTSLLRYFRSF